MNELTLTTPALLFSAVSLILLAYTNRFLSYAQVIRQLYDKHQANPEKVLVEQIKMLRKRLHLIRTMQLLGIWSLFLCVASMFLLYIGLQQIAVIAFGIGLFLMIASLSFSIWEIQISVKALDLHLRNMELPEQKKEC